MKISIYIVFLSLLLFSCKEERYKIAEEISEYIVENPEVLFKLEEKFSQIYNDSIVSPELKKEEYLMELFDTYYKVFQKSTIGSKIYIGYDIPEIKSHYISRREYHKDLNPKIDFYEFDEIFDVTIVKGFYAFGIDFAVKDNKMYLLHITISGHRL